MGNTRKETHLSKQYLSQVPLKDFCWAEDTEEKKHENSQSCSNSTCKVHHTMKHIEWSEQCQQLILNATVYHHVAKCFPPSIPYQRYFMKCILNKVEQLGQTVCEGLCETYVESLSQSEESLLYKSYYLSDSLGYVTLQESRKIISEGTTGLVSWTGGMLLTEWCLQHKEIFKDSTVLELGSGCGFCGISLSKSIALKSYVFSDAHHSVLSQLKKNIHLNNLSTETVKVIDLAWGDVKGSCENLSPDVVLAADVVFDPSLLPDLALTLQFLLSKAGCEAYIASTERNAETYQTFLSELDSLGIVHSEISTDRVPQLFYYNRAVPIRLLKLRAPISRSSAECNH